MVLNAPLYSPEEMAITETKDLNLDIVDIKLSAVVHSSKEFQISWRKLNYFRNAKS